MAWRRIWTWVKGKAKRGAGRGFRRVKRYAGFRSGRAYHYVGRGRGHKVYAPKRRGRY